MTQIHEALDKADFVKFLTDERECIRYDEKNFYKEKSYKLIKIRVDKELVYQIHEEKKILIVVNALYCSCHRDAYWDVAKMAGLEEVLSDSHTLVRI